MIRNKQAVINKLPSWIEYGAFILALVAGFLNAIGLLGFEHQAVSHLSGTATLFGASTLGDSLGTTLHLLGLMIFFLAGAILAGSMLHSSTLKLGRHYDTALAIETLLILTALLLLENGSYYGQFAASAACGLQNALATSYSGAIIRTTHVTGIFTDLGLMIGSYLRGESFDKRKFTLFLLIIAGFITGGIAGAYLFAEFLFKSLYFPAFTCLCLAFAYRMYAKRTKP
jgi:uncharacterized membrane protein YoaK (UPF0700 family)